MSAPTSKESPAAPTSGPAANPDTSGPAQRPVIVELQPNGALRAVVYTHDMTVDAIPCWTYVSNGLAKLGQKEIVFTVRRKPGEALDRFPVEPLRWFDLLYGLAQKGQFANDEFSYTQFSSAGFLGRRDIAMIIYARPQPLSGLSPAALPEEYLQAIPLTEPEAEVAKTYGVLRALSHLGLSVRYFPYPPWIDRERSSAITPDELSSSIVGKCATVKVSGVQAVKEGSDVCVYVRPWAVEPLQGAFTQIQPDWAFALFSELHDEADSCLVWKGGQTQPSAIGTSANHTSLCFVLLCPQQQSTYLQLVEDGYVLFLTDSDCERIRSAVASGNTFTLSAGGESKFHLEMMREEYHNPVDGLTYKTSGGWKQYRPQGAKSSSAGTNDHRHVEFGKIVLLNNPSPQECDPGALSEYIKKAEGVLISGIPEKEPVAEGSGKSAIVQFEISGGTLSNLHLRIDPNSDGLNVEALQTTLRQIPVPSAVREIRLQLFLDIWGGMPGAKEEL